MAVKKTAVFIASRFDEFAELRQLLKRKISYVPIVQFSPIDMNDGAVSHRPVLSECLCSSPQLLHYLFARAPARTLGMCSCQQQSHW